jgi:hypothetical protein|tara:strand:+ start:4142 stop:4495 length:354 start_codon:yes stop_codon:yes gene_type:complete|mmetsp:Transcript_11308/g.31962  ORF Transcript_11308/g.31962 Transcript_11308/m.31962 type:complete len:118 (-) Transcript_11308:107-460(-)
MAQQPPPLSPLNQAIEKALESVTECERSLNTGENDGLINKMESLVNHFTLLREASSTDETEIPVSVIKQIDEGKRPMARMVERILSVGKINEVTKGKANVFAEFEKSLEKELGKNKR